MALLKDIIIQFIIGLVVTLFSTYLFSLQRIDFTMLIVIIIGTIIFSMVILIQLKINELSERLDEQKKGVLDLDKRFKNIEDLNNIRLDIKELQKSVFKK
ncbi:hypothetical protein COV15_01195 [Candidatus Woesearchaeota archaeon CG10_big_fil_rev_8_21_14_0_10_34_12]|nr:MAG: hypothetical protein COV15_01195 [Candidatus Woesearchaeota archaeon CG10_big_fil_rev_8_21_14_0_10_34_12]